MTPEGRVKEKVKRHLKSIGAYYFMPVQTGYGMSSVDFLVCLRGNFIGLETKAGKGKPTRRQQLVMQDIHRAGGAVITINEENVDALPRLIPQHFAL